jgi:hypothetical protein
MQQRVRKLVLRVQQELKDNNNYWAITITKENGLAMYRLVKRQQDNHARKNKTPAQA